MRLVALARRARRARTNAAKMATHMKLIPRINGHLRAVTVSAATATGGAGAAGLDDATAGAGTTGAAISGG